MTSCSTRSGAETNYRAAVSAALPGACGGPDDGCASASRGPQFPGRTPHLPIQPGSFSRGPSSLGLLSKLPAQAMLIN